MFKILIVNNQFLIRKTLLKLIKESNLSKDIKEFNSFKKALDYTKNNSVDIIFMDLVLAKTNLENIVEEIKEIDERIKVFFLAQAWEMSKISKLDISVDKIILKPISKKSLLDKLNEVKDGYIYIDTDDFIKKFDLALMEKNFDKSVSFVKEYIESIKDDRLDLLRKKISYLIELILKYKASKTYDKKVSFNLDNIDLKDEFEVEDLSFKIINYYYRQRAKEAYPILEGVFSYIDKNIYENISLKDIVSNCAISQGYLSRLFRSQLHMTVVNYINLCKVNIAKNLIRNENLSIFELTEKLSYSDYSYFSKVFKKHENITIQEFKKKLE